MLDDVDVKEVDVKAACTMYVHGYQNGMARALPRLQLHSGAFAVTIRRQAQEPRHFGTASAQQDQT